MDPNDQSNKLPKINDNSSAAAGSAADDDTDASNQQTTPAISQPEPRSTTNVPVPDEAADSDLIEKEWVERAKQIVDHTKDDPHEQQRAISQMKTDYLKKRYNKDINPMPE